MGFLDRMSTVVQARMEKIMGRMEDPRETLDLSYEKQLKLLQDVKRGVAEVTTSKKRMEMQKAKLQMNLDKLDSQAKDALQAGREDLARKALENKSALQGQMQTLDQQIADLVEQQQKLVAAESRLATKVESFRTKKESIKAQYSAAEAQVRITESVTGISEEMADVGMAVQKAEEKTENMKARSAALDDLLETGTITDYSGGDELGREIAQAKAKNSVDDDLARMKAEMNIQIKELK
jgi:phage shock protein A